VRDLNTLNLASRQLPIFAYLSVLVQTV